MAACRLIIGLDACFMKGLYPGQIMSAVGRDDNENIFPIAIIVVGVEMKDSWNWFLTKLTDDPGTVEEIGWTFISDRQKVPTILSIGLLFNFGTYHTIYCVLMRIFFVILAFCANI